MPCESSSSCCSGGSTKPSELCAKPGIPSAPRPVDCSGNVRDSHRDDISTAIRINDISVTDTTRVSSCCPFERVDNCDPASNNILSACDVKSDGSAHCSSKCNDNETGVARYLRVERDDESVSFAEGANDLGENSPSSFLNQELAFYAGEDKCCDAPCLQQTAFRKLQDLSPTDEKAARIREDCNNIVSGPCCKRKKQSKSFSKLEGSGGSDSSSTYSDRLESLGCICKALFARSLGTSCTTRTPSALERKKSRSASPSVSVKSEKVDTCCAASSGLDTSKKATTGCSKGLKQRRDQHVEPFSTGSLCSTQITSCQMQRCCERSETATEQAAPCKREVANDSCNASANLDLSTQSAHPLDLEQGMSASEHVIVAIQGMTCTGCETKLQRSLRDMGPISNIQTSLVLSRAEFDLDTKVLSVEKAIAQLHRATGFSCEKLTSKGRELDVLVPNASDEFVCKSSPSGVLDMVSLDANTVRIYYDTTIIGARDLVAKGFYAPLELAPPREDPSIAAGRRHVRRVGWFCLLSAILTIPVLILAWAPLPEHEIIYGSVSLALATTVQVVVAGPFYPAALKALIFSRVIEMDLLVVLSTSAAYIFSVVAFGYLVSGNPLSTGEFFETSTLLVTLIMVGRFISTLARQKAVESISVRSLQATTANLVVDGSNEHTEIDARLLQYGDVFKVLPDSRIVTDGTVISGHSEVDESMMTGESRLIEKEVGSAIVAGSVNGSGSLKVRVTRLPGDNSISSIANMVDEAKLYKPKTQQLADTVAGYFVPVVVILTIITFIIWIAIGIAIRGQSASGAAVNAITYSVAVLIVSCPCAIGLAVPMVIVIAGGVGADRGVVCKSAETIELARKISHVVFDKTGTLTRGELDVCSEKYMDSAANSVATLALGLTSTIKHPVASAIAKHLKAREIEPAVILDVETITGKGIKGRFGDVTIQGGNSRWLGVESVPEVNDLSSRGFTVFCVVVDGALRGIYGLNDTVRPGAFDVISQLTARGIKTSIVSGDDDGPVKSVASALGIPTSNAKSRCSPGDKQKYVEYLVSQEKQTVLFCGDGTNDAVALAQASIGVHVNGGTDVAQSAADVVLVRPTLSGILALIDLSRASFLRITFNFGWAFVYNVFAILLAAGAFVNARIPPAYAGLGELVSVLPVIVIALSLKWSKFGQT